MPLLFLKTTVKSGEFPLELIFYLIFLPCTKDLSEEIWDEKKKVQIFFFLKPT